MLCMYGMSMVWCDMGYVIAWIVNVKFGYGIISWNWFDLIYVFVWYRLVMVLYGKRYVI